MQLHNPHRVHAEWSIKRPAVDSPKLRDWDCFMAQPAEGVLEPGARTNVSITFTPLVCWGAWHPIGAAAASAATTAAAAGLQSSRVACKLRILLHVDG